MKKKSYFTVYGIIQDISWTAFIKVGYIVGQMVVNVVLARELGVDGFGYYALVMAYVQILVVPAQLGFPSALVRQMSQFEGNGAGQSASRHLNVAIIFVSSTSVLLAVCWALSGFLIEATDLLTVLLLILGLSIVDVGGGALRGLGSVVESQIAQQLIRPVTFLAMLVGIVWLYDQRLDQRTALLLHAFAALFAAVYSLISSKTKITKMPSEGVYNTRLAILSSSLPFMLLASIQVLNYQVALAVMGFKLETAQVGIYRTAVQIADGLSVVLFAFSIALGPRIARLHTLSKVAELKQLLLRTHFAAVAVMLPLAGGVALFAQPIITIIFGTDYSAGAGPLVILAIGKILYAGVGFSGLGMSMMGYPSRSAVALSLGLLMNLVLTLTLIPPFGMEGAAWATLLTSFGSNLLATVFLFATIRRL